jgi:hypothetical protein
MRRATRGGLRKGREYVLKQYDALGDCSVCAKYGGVVEGFYEFFSPDFGCGKQLFTPAALTRCEIRESLKGGVVL